MTRNSVLSCFALVLATLSLVNVASADGPDVIVGSLPAVANWTSAGAVNGLRAYSIGHTPCNIGTENLSWIASTNRHPVVGQDLYRLKDGRFEQIGYSWLKHTYLTLTGQACAPPPACNGQGGSVLGVGCSGPYTASDTGSYGQMGPRYQVNATTGVFTYPFDHSAPNNPPIGKRLQVLETELDPALNPGALYFVSVQYVTADDAQAGNGRNNMSYRQVTVGPMPLLNISLAGPIQRMMPGIQAWKDNDPVVELHAVDYPESFDPPGEPPPFDIAARFWIGASATDLGDGMWHYEYAVQNLNSDRGAGSFSVPRGPGVIVTHIGFHDVNSHSGDGPGAVSYSGADWTATITPAAVTWSAESFDVNPNANAIRWGRLYNFRFDANAAPTTGDVTLGLFKPGSPAGVSDNTVVPTPMPGNPADLNGDGVVNSRDLGILLSSWSIPTRAPGCGGATPCPADLDGDGVVTSLDLGILLSNWTI